MVSFFHAEMGRAAAMNGQGRILPCVVGARAPSFDLELLMPGVVDAPHDSQVPLSKSVNNDS